MDQNADWKTEDEDEVQEEQLVYDQDQDQVGEGEAEEDLVLDDLDLSEQEQVEEADHSNTQLEPFLDPANERMSAFPIVYDDLWQLQVEHRGAHWTWDQDIDYSQDLHDFTYELNEHEQHSVMYALAFFSASDFLVNKSVRTDKAEVVIPEVQGFNANKEDREFVHSLTYAHLLRTIVPDERKQAELRNAVSTMPIIREKSAWMIKWLKENWAVRQVITAVMEGVFFSGLFTLIFWLKKKHGGKMPGLCLANEYIFRDENLHLKFAALLFKKYVVYKPDQQRVVDLIMEAVEIEHRFMRETFPVRQMGMNSDKLCGYISYLADEVYYQLGYENDTLYGEPNPVDLMNTLSMPIKACFFSGRTSGYANAANMVSSNKERAHENVAKNGMF